MKQEKSETKKEIKGIFISFEGEIDFKGEINYQKSSQMISTCKKLQEYLLVHMDKQVLAFGMQCAIEGALAYELYGDEGKISQEEIKNVVEKVAKDVLGFK